MRAALIKHLVWCSGVLLLASLPLTAQARGFTLFAHSVLDDDGWPVVRVSTSVPYSQLVFLKKDGQFVARFSLYLQVLDKKQRVVDSAVLNETITVPNYEETRSAKKTSNLSHGFLLRPDDYIVRATLSVMDTHLAFARQSPVTVPNYFHDGIGLSKPRFFVTSIDTSAHAVVLTRIERNGDIPGQEKAKLYFFDLNKQPAVKFDIYLEEESSIQATLYYEVTDEDKNPVLYGRKKVTLSGKKDEFFATFNGDLWDEGFYLFHVKVEVGEPPRSTEAKLGFNLLLSNEMLTAHYERTLTVLSYIAETEELEELQYTPVSRRALAWTDFWKRRDPSPDTDENEALEEHWQRVRYVNANFSAVQPGWKSDRGKVYIRYGEPDQVGVQMDSMMQGEYLMWYYFDENLTFVFYDRFAQGEYKLTNTNSF